MSSRIIATYRLQVRTMGLAALREMLPYFQRLGISHLYFSPIVQARPGSGHGYDILDAAILDPEIGSEDELLAIFRDLEERSMGIVQDVVPNHMAADPRNPWFREVLRSGPASPFARYFDIDWSADPEIGDRIVLPILGRPLSECLQAGELSLSIEGTEIVLRYFEQALPLSSRSLASVLRTWLEGTNLPTFEDGSLRETVDVLRRAIAALPPPEARDRRTASERAASEAHLLSSVRSCMNAKELRSSIEEHLMQQVEEGLEQILERQHYRLEFWRAAAGRVNYRRFFDIDGLIGVRVEDPEVFAARHVAIARWVTQGPIDLVRVDHVDGLADPHEYLENLEELFSGSRPENPPGIIVEKILADGEELPAGWPIVGTTGYEFLDAIGRVFLDPSGVEQLAATYHRVTESPMTFEETALACKREVLDRLFPGERDDLTRRLRKLAEKVGYAGDLESLTSDFLELTLHLPVYRTYLRQSAVSERDRAILELTRLRVRGAGLADEAGTLFLLKILVNGVGEAVEDERWQLIRRWQQLTGPLAAKGVEDTALYRYLPLLSRNEVGGDPGVILDSQEAFHELMHDSALRGQRSLDATSTHDTKRGEDVRARLHVLSEVPGVWDECLLRWSRQNERHRVAVGQKYAPSRSEEMLIYQTLLGTWPSDGDLRAEADYVQRIHEYLIKALREAKVNTSWRDQSPEYEQAVLAFVDRILDPAGDGGAFLEDFLALGRILAFQGALGSIAQVVLKTASPGVPDFYQGTELWDLSLVDPDNRHPVDFAQRERILGELQSGREHPEDELLSSWHDGRVKLWVMHRCLRARGEHAGLFVHGSYAALRASSPYEERVCAFLREHEGSLAIAAVPTRTYGMHPVFSFPLGERVWSDGILELQSECPLRWREVITGTILERTGRGLQLEELFTRFPAALLVSMP